MGMPPPAPGGGYAAGLAQLASPPPMSPPGPPPPTGAGAMPTGSADSMSTPRTAASAAIMALRQLVPHYPALGPAIEGFTAQIQAAASKQGGAPGAAGKPPTVPASAATPDAGDVDAPSDDDA